MTVRFYNPKTDKLEELPAGAIATAEQLEQMDVTDRSRYFGRLEEETRAKQIEASAAKREVERKRHAAYKAAYHAERQARQDKAAAEAAASRVARGEPVYDPVHGHTFSNHLKRVRGDAAS